MITEKTNSRGFHRPFFYIFFTILVLTTGMARADILTLQPGKSAEGTVSRDDLLYRHQYVVDIVNAQSQVVFELSIGNSADLDLFVRKDQAIILDEECGCLYANWWSDGYSRVERIQIDNPATGRYYIAFVNWDDLNAPYSIKVSFGTTSTDDHGDRSGSATSMQINTTSEGLIQPKTDVDYFSFPAVEGKKYVMQTSLKTLRDSVLTLFDTDGTSRILENDDNAGLLASRIEWSCGKSGTYFIRVESYRQKYEGSYQVTITEVNQVEKWAILLGAEDYSSRSGASNLPGCALDVENMKKALTQKYQFTTSHIQTYIDRTNDNFTLQPSTIADAFQWLNANADSNDIVVVYYTGHGSGGLYDSLDDIETLALPRGDYTETQMASDLRNLRAMTRIVILDSCHSGGFGQSLPSGCWLLAACRYDENSKLCKFGSCPVFSGGSVFTAWLTDGITKGVILNHILLPWWNPVVDWNFNGKISLREAFDYAKIHTELNLIDLLKNDVFHPCIFPSQGDFEFPVN